MNGETLRARLYGPDGVVQEDDLSQVAAVPPAAVIAVALVKAFERIEALEAELARKSPARAKAAA